MNKSNYTKGYSLIELLVYITLFITISLVVMQSLLYAMKTYSNARTYRSIQQNAELAMERITREIRQADTISVTGNVFGSSPGTLVISGINDLGNSFTDSITVAGGAVQITTNSVASTLTSSEVIVNDLTFWNISAAASDAIKLKMTLSTTRPPVITKSFYTTVILRN